MTDTLIFNLIITISLLILSITIHEFSHLLIARWLGSDMDTNRLTLDPSKHIDPIWTLALPILSIIISTSLGNMYMPFFATGKPICYNKLKLSKKFNNKKINLKTAEFLISIAGPISNLALCIISFILIFMINFINYKINIYPLFALLFQLLYLNFTIFIFNLIPIPPLDGYKILTSILSDRLSIKYKSLISLISSYHWLIIFLLIIIISHLMHVIINKIIILIYNLI